MTPIVRILLSPCARISAANDAFLVRAGLESGCSPRAANPLGMRKAHPGRFDSEPGLANPPFSLELFFRSGLTALREGVRWGANVLDQSSPRSKNPCFLCVGNLVAGVVARRSCRSDCSCDPNPRRLLCRLLREVRALLLQPASRCGQGADLD